MLLCEGLHDCLVLHHLGLPNQSIGNAIDRYRETFFYWSPKKFLVFDPKSKKRKVKFHFFGRDFAIFTFLRGQSKSHPVYHIVYMINIKNNIIYSHCLLFLRSDRDTKEAIGFTLVHCCMTRCHGI